MFFFRLPEFFAERIYEDGSEKQSLVSKSNGFGRSRLHIESISHHITTCLTLMMFSLSSLYLCMKGVSGFHGYATLVFTAGTLLVSIPAVIRLPLSNCIYYESPTLNLDDKFKTEDVRSYSSFTNVGVFVAKKLPKVRVMIPCYNEPIDVIKDTVLGALSINYPKELYDVVLCDDGNRPELQAMILEEGNTRCRYFAREKVKGEEHHAKAGNLNAAKRYCDAKYGKVDYVLFLDSDMVPVKDVLKKVLPHFDGKKNIAFVQTRDKMFYNLFGADIIANHQNFHMDVFMNMANEAGVAYCCGTGCVWDSKVLDKIGGWQYYSVTEDFNTTISAWLNGYRGFYLNETCCYGLAPVPLSDIFTQRMRWMYGPFQVFQNRFYEIQYLGFQEKCMIFYMLTSQSAGRLGTILITLSMFMLGYNGSFELLEPEKKFDQLEYALAGCSSMYLAVAMLTKLVISHISSVETYCIASLSELWETFWVLPYLVQQFLSKAALRFNVTAKEDKKGSTSDFRYAILSQLWAVVCFGCGTALIYDQVHKPWNTLGFILALYMSALMMLFAFIYSIPTIYVVLSRRWSYVRSEFVDYKNGYPEISYQPPTRSILSKAIDIVFVFFFILSFGMTFFSGYMYFRKDF